MNLYDKKKRYDDIENIKEDLINISWEGWIIKSAITKKEEVTND